MHRPLHVGAAPTRSRWCGGHTLTSSNCVQRTLLAQRAKRIPTSEGFEHGGASSRMYLQVSGAAGEEALCVAVSPPNHLRAISLTRHALLYFCCEDPFLTPW